MNRFPREQMQLLARVWYISGLWWLRRAPIPLYRFVRAHRDPCAALAFGVALILLCAAKPALPAVPDREPPCLIGIKDITVPVGKSVSYRSGVSAVDAVDGAVLLHIDAGAVNLDKPGIYDVIYWAVDAAGNTVRQSARVIVQPPDDDDENDALAAQVDELADEILSEITEEGMSQREIARAIFDYVHGNIHYTGSSGKHSWLRAAYNGFTRGIGDCFNYFACSKALLTRAGIENVDLQRVGGISQHYWQLVNVGDGWYHFDACPHPREYWLDGFLFTEQQARDFTETCAQNEDPERAERFRNYYVYDYEACPVQPEGMPETGNAPPPV